MLGSESSAWSSTRFAPPSRDVEFAVLDSPNEGVPLPGSEEQLGAVRVLAVPNGDYAWKVRCDFDAVAPATTTERALLPGGLGEVDAVRSLTSIESPLP